MPLFSWRKWLNRLSQNNNETAGNKARCLRSRARGKRKAPQLEALEERWLPSNLYTVNVAGDAGLGANGTSSSGQLAGDIRYVIGEADKPVNAGSTIVFDTTKSGSTITLSDGELQISDDTTINGPGSNLLTITGNNTSRVFNITSQNPTASIAPLTITPVNASPANVRSPGTQAS